MKQVWCPVCMSMVTATINESVADFTEWGNHYRFRRKEAVCNSCGNKLNVPSIVDQNVRARITTIYGGKNK